MPSKPKTKTKIIKTEFSPKPTTTRYKNNKNSVYSNIERPGTNQTESKKFLNCNNPVNFSL